MTTKIHAIVTCLMKIGSSPMKKNGHQRLRRLKVAAIGDNYEKLYTSPLCKLALQKNHISLVACHKQGFGKMVESKAWKALCFSRKDYVAYVAEDVYYNW